jgi:hypothetical protein
MHILIEPPIILDERGDTGIFDSVESAELEMEPIDVEDNRYVAFDSVGRLLRILPTTPRVTLEAAEEVSNHTEQVRMLLIKFLRDCGSTDPNLPSLKLEELVQRSLPFKNR